MFILRIEHPVPSFEGWKRAFDSDPVGRKRGGVRRYRVSRPTDDPRFVTIDLEFDTAPQAEAMLTALRGLWQRVEGDVMRDPHTRVLEMVDSQELR
jgi:hypothetical protein